MSFNHRRNSLWCGRGCYVNQASFEKGGTKWRVPFSSQWHTDSCLVTKIRAYLLWVLN